jgi:hypothetical protein
MALSGAWLSAPTAWTARRGSVVPSGIAGVLAMMVVLASANGVLCMYQVEGGPVVGSMYLRDGRGVRQIISPQQYHMWPIEHRRSQLPGL